MAKGLRGSVTDVCTSTSYGVGADKLAYTTANRYVRPMSTQLAIAARVRRDAASGAMRRRRLAAMTSQPELAQEIGVTVATLSRWERGVLRPSPTHACRWDRALRAVEEVEADQ